MFVLDLCETLAAGVPTQARCGHLRLLGGRRARRPISERACATLPTCHSGSNRTAGGRPIQARRGTIRSDTIQQTTGRTSTSSPLCLRGLVYLLKKNLRKISPKSPLNLLYICTDVRSEQVYTMTSTTRTSRSSGFTTPPRSVSRFSSHTASSSPISLGTTRPSSRPSTTERSPTAAVQCHPQPTQLTRPARVLLASINVRRCLLRAWRCRFMLRKSPRCGWSTSRRSVTLINKSVDCSTRWTRPVWRTARRCCFWVRCCCFWMTVANRAQTFMLLVRCCFVCCLL